MPNKVLEHTTRNYASVKNGVKGAMGGKILEYEAKTIKREGKMQPENCSNIPSGIFPEIFPEGISLQN